MTASDGAKKALEGVTPGPWGMETVRTSCGVCHKIGPWPHKWRHGADMSACIYDDYPSLPAGTDNMLANARFIAWAREGVPALLAEIAAKDAEIARLQGALRLLHDNVVTAFPTLADLGPVANARAALKGDTHE